LSKGSSVASRVTPGWSPASCLESMPRATSTTKTPFLSVCIFVSRAFR